MEYIRMKGDEYAVREDFENLGIKAPAAMRIINYLCRHKELLSDSESISDTTEWPDFPAGCIGLMIPKTKYYINVKTATLFIVALLLDEKTGFPLFSSLLALKGISSTAVTALSEADGEKCIMKETLARKTKKGSADILDSLKGECGNNDLQCKYRIDGKCRCSKEDVLRIYDKLSARNIFVLDNDGFYKYQW